MRVDSHCRFFYATAAIVVLAFFVCVVGCRPKAKELPKVKHATPPVAVKQVPAEQEARPAEMQTQANTPGARVSSGGQNEDDVRPTQQATNTNSSQLGAELYARHCAACHGAQGNGQGLAAAYLFPKPRDFRAGQFRLVSTANNVPSRDDLHAVLLRGMPGSSMPPWTQLSLKEREALVDEIMRLRQLGARGSYIAVLKEEDELTDTEIAEDDVQQEIAEYAARFTTPGESTVVPEIGEPSDTSFVAAKETYAKYGCLQCHGANGKGDGVQKMVDNEGYPITPRDFTAGVFKGGHDPASLYRRIAYGMPGTPMPSSKQLTPEQIIELVHFIRSMSTLEQREAAVLNREQLVVHEVDKLPAEATASAWNEVPPVAIHMAPLWWREGADPDLQVQAMHDGTTMAVRISWRDITPNHHAAQSEAFEDAVAMELYRGEAEPFVGMGAPDSPIDVWFWDADRAHLVDVQDQYPNVVVDIYPLSEDQVATAEYKREGTRFENQPEISLPAVAAGNQIAPGHATSGGSNLMGAGPGSSTFRIPKSQLVTAHGDWQEDRWTVVLTRTLSTAAPSEGISLEPGAKASVAFAVWDGSANDRDGKKLITVWQDLVLQP